MTATKREKGIFGSSVQNVSRSDDQVVYKITDKTGQVVMTSNQIFPGILLIYNDVHARRCFVEQSVRGSIIEVNDCKEGRIECAFQDDFFYLTQEDISISIKSEAPHESYFPISHYHGVAGQYGGEKDSPYFYP